MRSPFRVDGTDLYYEDKIVGDTRGMSFASGDTINTYKGEKDATYQLAPLPGADILFVVRDEVFGIERKSWNDLVGSRWSGRLADQLRRMMTCYDTVILCIEVEQMKRRSGHTPTLKGLWRKKDTILWDDMMTTLLDWQDMGVRIIFTTGPAHTVRYVRGLRKKYLSGRRSELIRTMKPIMTGAEGLEGLVAIAGIGPKLAQKLVTNHGSLRQVYAHYTSWKEGSLASKDGLALSKKMLKGVGR